MRTHVVVIGAGVGGLASALRLARAGYAVTVFEQADRVGGKLGRYERNTAAGTFRFDTGPSLLTLPQIFDDLLGEPGLDRIRLDPVIRHVFADGTVLDSTSDPSAMAARIRTAFGDRAGRDWERLWRRAGVVWSASWRHILQSTVDSPLDLARLAWRLRDLAAVQPGGTLRGVGHSMVHSEELRVLLDRYATYAGSDPRRAPAALIAIPYAELTFGGWYLRGGLATLADTLRARCEALGVRVLTGTPVAGIEAPSGRVLAVRLVDSTRIPAEVVVANADAAAVYRDLLPPSRRAQRGARRLLAARSLGGFVLLLGVRGTTPGLAQHTVFFPPDYDAEFDAIFGRCTGTGVRPTRPGRVGQPAAAARPAADPTVYVSVADDPAVRPDGHEAWFVLVNAPPQGPFDWRPPGVADAYADRVLATLAARGLDVRDRILFREVRTPADLEASTWTPGGAIYGTPSHGLAGLLRPRNRGPVRGLYLVGGSTHPGGGLPMVALCAANVAAAITRHHPPRPSA